MLNPSPHHLLRTLELAFQAPFRWHHFSSLAFHALCQPPQPAHSSRLNGIFIASLLPSQVCAKDRLIHVNDFIMFVCLCLTLFGKKCEVRKQFANCKTL